MGALVWYNVAVYRHTCYKGAGMVYLEYYRARRVIVGRAGNGLSLTFYLARLDIELEVWND